MSAIRNAKRRPVLLAILATVVLVPIAAYAAVGAPAAKPGITVQISPASQSVVRGSNASYTATLTSTGGFAGAVALSASGLPGGATASFSPTSRTLTATGTTSTATSVLTVATTSSTPVGSYTFTVTGTSGKVSGSVTAGLTVNYPVSGSLSMSATPASVTMGAGSTAVYTVQLTRSNVSGDVAFSVLGGLPTGAAWSFSPNPATGSSSTLQVTTTAGTPDSTNTLYLVASGKDTGNVTRYAYASVQLVINTSGSPFTISGNLDGLLAPGKTLPLALSLANPNKKSLSVTNLSVTVQSVTRASGVTLPCLIGDYAVVQYSGPYPLVVPGSSTKTLSQLGVTPSQSPQIRFLNTTSNQDGCKGATLSLSYSGSGTGN
jgi:hypothetical protein